MCSKGLHFGALLSKICRRKPVSLHPTPGLQASTQLITKRLFCHCYRAQKSRIGLRSSVNFLRDCFCHLKGELSWPHLHLLPHSRSKKDRPTR